MPCIWANQNGVKPSGAFASIDLSPARSLGTEFRRALTVQNILETKEYTLSITAFDCDVSGLWQKLHKTSIVDRCVTNKISFLRIAGVTDLTALLDGRKWASMINISFIITHTDYIVDDASYIADATIIGTIGDTTPAPIETDESIVEVIIESEVQ